jgi:TRAP-type C4-dicarboxylate transport system substrate-binding protein
MMNIDTWNAMPDAIKTPFMEAAQIAADEGNALDRELEAEYLGLLGEAGMEIYTPNREEMALWRDLAMATWDEAELNPELVSRLREMVAQ